MNSNCSVPKNRACQVHKANFTIMESFSMLIALDAANGHLVLPITAVPALNV